MKSWSSTLSGKHDYAAGEALLWPDEKRYGPFIIHEGFGVASSNLRERLQMEVDGGHSI